MSHSTNKIALVIGAPAEIGGATAAALSRHGWTVRGLTRRPHPGNGTIEWIAGDAMNAADVLSAAQGAALIVSRRQPSGFRNWATQVLPMIDNTSPPPRRSARASYCRAPSTISAPTLSRCCMRIPPASVDPQGRDPGGDGEETQGGN